MINWIIFDVGNVLIDIDLEAPIHELVKSTGVDREKLKKFFSESFKEGTNQISTHEMYQTGKLSTDEYIHSLKKLLNVPISDDELKKALFLVLGNEREAMVSVIRSLRTRYKIGCFSNTTPLHWQGLKEYCFFFNELTSELTSYGLGEVKPKKEAFQRMLDELKSFPQNVIFIDDSEKNINAAKLMGINAFQFTTKDQLITDLSTIIQIP